MASEINKTRSLLVTGSRSIRDAAFVRAKLDTLPRPGLLIHGGAIGVDTLAGQWAKDHAIPVKVYRPDFKTWPVAAYRWKAFLVRDMAMVDVADDVVAIWDGTSSGTKKTMDYAVSKDKFLGLFMYE